MQVILVITLPYWITTSYLQIALFCVFALILIINRLILRTNIQFDISIVIQAPEERVFNLAVDFTNWTRVYPHIVSVRLLHEEKNERVIESRDITGATVTEVLRVSAHKIESEGSTNRGIKTEETQLFETTKDGGTLLTLVYRGSGRGFRRKGPLTKQLKDSTQNSLESIKHLAESS